MKYVKLLGWLTVAIFSGCVFIGVLALLVLLSLPRVNEIDGCITTTMYRVELCPDSEHYVPFSQIAPEVAMAVVASEDTSFYSHHGFDWFEIKQSFKSNLEHKQIHRGGSTLTQQLAKNIWLSKDKSYWRKFKEAYLTYNLEKQYHKEFLLEKYLNVVEFGPNLFGVKDAANFYFKRAPKDLNLLQAVYLAFLLPNPEGYSKSFKKGELTPFAHKIMGIILKRLVQFKKISMEEYTVAAARISQFPWTDIARGDFVAPPPADAAPPDQLQPETIDEFPAEESPDAEGD